MKRIILSLLMLMNFLPLFSNKIVNNQGSDTTFQNGAKNIENLEQENFKLRKSPNAFFLKVNATIRIYALEHITKEVRKDNELSALTRDLATIFTQGVSKLHNINTPKAVTMAVKTIDFGNSKTLIKIEGKGFNRTSIEIKGEIYSENYEVIKALEEFFLLMDLYNESANDVGTFHTETKLVLNVNFTYLYNRIQGIKVRDSESWILMGEKYRNTSPYSNKQLKDIMAFKVILIDKKFRPNKIYTSVSLGSISNKDRINGGVHFGVLIPLKPVKLPYYNAFALNNVDYLNVDLSPIYKGGISKRWSKINMDLGYSRTSLNIQNSFVDSLIPMQGGYFNIGSNIRFVNFSLGFIYMADESYRGIASLYGLTSKLGITKANYSFNLEASSFLLNATNFGNSDLVRHSTDIRKLGNVDLANLNYAIGGSLCLHLNNISLTGGAIAPINASINTELKDSATANTKIVLIPKIGLDINFRTTKLSLNYAFTNATTIVSDNKYTSYLHGLDIAFGTRFKKVNPELGVILLADKKLVGESALKGLSLGANVNRRMVNFGIKGYGFIYDIKKVGTYESPVTNVYSLQNFNSTNLKYGISGSISFQF
jgi:hypothetical protein